VPEAEPRILYTPRPGATPESSRNAIARCYAYLLERRRLREEEAARPGGHEDARKGDQDARTYSNCT